MQRDLAPITARAPVGGLVAGAVPLDGVLAVARLAEGRQQDELVLQQGPELAPLPRHLHVGVALRQRPVTDAVRDNGALTCRTSAGECRPAVVPRPRPDPSTASPSSRPNAGSPRSPSNCPLNRNSHLMHGEITGTHFDPDRHPLQFPMVELPAGRVIVPQVRLGPHPPDPPIAD